MSEIVKQHFDLLYLFVILCVLLVFCWFRPETSREWVAGVIGAILMRIRPGGNTNGNGGTK